MKNIVMVIAVTTIVFASCKKEEGVALPNATKPDLTLDRIATVQGNTFASINPSRFIATLTFDGKDNLDGGEQNYPISFRFNTTQDANGDKKIDAEDNLENLIRASIGQNIKGTGRTGLSNRGANDQRPAVYFHFVQKTYNNIKYDVYEYWYYYADNDWINDHEHDWEKYFVYVLNGVPKKVRVSWHEDFNSYNWSDFTKVGENISLGVEGGSHGMKKSSEDGVKIDYTGKINTNNGTLKIGNGQQIPWVIYSNDLNVSGAIKYLNAPSNFYYGDKFYKNNSNEWGDVRSAPWMRSEWNSPPAP